MDDEEEEILVKNNKLSTTIFEVAEDEEKVREALQTHSTITIIDVAYHYKECNIKIFCDALHQSNSLTKLYVSDANFSDEQMFALSHALKLNLTLKSLRLGGDSITAEGAKALSDFLKSNSTLSELDLYNNSIGDEGARALSDSLKLNSTLTNLNVREEDQFFGSVINKGLYAIYSSNLISSKTCKVFGIGPFNLWNCHTTWR